VEQQPPHPAAGGKGTVIRVNDQYEVAWQPGMTVQDVLDALRFSFRMIVVKLDGRVVLRQDFARTEVPDGTEMQAMHLISGG
jgi:sulfur carrier protein